MISSKFQSPNFFYGVVENRHDPLKLGRCQIRVLGIHSHKKTPDDHQGIETVDLPWAYPAQSIDSAAMNGIGQSPIGPVEGTWVIGFSRDGEVYSDLVFFATIGGVPETTPDTSDGFNDPFGNYPKSRYLNEPDTNRLSRNEKINDTVIQQKWDTTTTTIPTVYDSWDEPESPYAASYPFNHVKETESGHFYEMDDSVGSERIHILHRAGTFYEFHPNGDLVVKKQNDNYEVVVKDDRLYVHGNKFVSVKGNDDVYIEGNQDVKIDGNQKVQIEGNCDLLIKGDYNVQVEGNYNIDVMGNKSTQVNGNETHDVTGNHTLRILANKILDVTGIDTTRITGACFLDVTGNYLKRVTGNITTMGYTNIFSFARILNQVGGLGSAVLTSNGATGVKGGTVDIDGGAKLTQSASKHSTAGEAVAPVSAVVIPPVTPVIAVPALPQIPAIPPVLTVNSAKAEVTPYSVEDFALSRDDLPYTEAELKAKGISTAIPTSQENYQPAPSEAEEVNVVCDGVEILSTADLLSNSFTLGQLSTNAVVSHYKVVPQHGLTEAAIICNLKALATNTLDAIKAEYPTMMVTSAFRQGSSGSKHEYGLAADMQVSNMSNAEYFEMAKWITENVPFSSIILEYKDYGTKLPWIHISYQAGSTRNIIQTYFNNRKYRDGLSLIV